MKKTWVFLVALALIAVSVPTFAGDFTLKGDFVWLGNYDFAAGTATGAASHARVKLDSMVDKNTEFYVELRDEGVTGGWANAADFYLKGFKVSSNITGALGLELPVAVKLTAGYFETYFTNWWGADSTGWMFYYGGDNKLGLNWDNKLVNMQQYAAGAIQLDVTSSVANLHYYNSLDMKNIMIGADATIGPVGAYLAYGVGPDVSGYTGMDKGDISLETKITIPEISGLKIAVLPFFRYGLGDSVYTFGGGVTADYTMFHLGFGMGGTSYSIPDKYFVEASIAPVDNARFTPTHTSIRRAPARSRASTWAPATASAP